MSSSSNFAEAIGPLAERAKTLGFDLPAGLVNLLAKAPELSGKTADKDIRSYIYREMFTFLAINNGIGDGCSLIFPDEITDAIRKMYPADIKNYVPKSRKRKNFYQVGLAELLEVYREGDLRDGLTSKSATQETDKGGEGTLHTPVPSKKNKEL